MKISCFTDYGPLNSKPVFEAFIKSMRQAGDTVFVNKDDGQCDVAVIWSVLWQGRMAKYRNIWNTYRKKNKPVVVLEVGGIKRNETWKIGINGVNREADFHNDSVGGERWGKFNVELSPWGQTGDDIIVCGQHTNSHQWRNNPPMSKWFDQQITEIRKYTDKPIIIRPHPRNHVAIDTAKYKNVKIVGPRRDKNTYDDTDLAERLKSAWAVVSHSSNPAMTAVFSGIPVYVSEASLSYDVGNKTFENINNPNMPDRQKWTNKLSYTEWWTDEIEQGLPWKRIKKRLEEKYLNENWWSTEIKPIEWKPYKGEMVNTVLTIRKGKKIQETAWYEDRVNAVPRGNAYCIGNGPSRKDFDLNKLKATGQTYGCNALYRDFIPDYIFSIDSPITLTWSTTKFMRSVYTTRPPWKSIVIQKEDHHIYT